MALLVMLSFESLTGKAWFEILGQLEAKEKMTYSIKLAKKKMTYSLKLQSLWAFFFKTQEKSV